MSRILGVVNTFVGYANGQRKNPSYEEVCNLDTGHVETVKVIYDSKKVSLKQLTLEFFKIIDPFTKDRQGGDIGNQYRTGIYYTDERDKNLILEILIEKQKEYDTTFGKKILTEIEPLSVFYPAEEYHQKYLDKNPNGYCHVDLNLLDKNMFKIEENSTELTENYNLHLPKQNSRSKEEKEKN
ncbi:peptide-methionine (S)-S-oxide reductase MsrA [Methanobrevibacter curvatus]|uniref:Peptide methionine sulfoxide reductase MsrA n=1 Tax=Methanobrevibacter curvatus TaxID=49547 RepID=A0A166BDT5_9EURY|nr:peptide-methionine (S)-S-oxide reductase MsrA [Methanobrevibacter curvatus]KZX13201.1 peptide methionine sulfoxide reductase MsrA/MsrB [Methanobrevibacter curvatus]